LKFITLSKQNFTVSLTFFVSKAVLGCLQTRLFLQSTLLSSKCVEWCDQSTLCQNSVKYFTKFCAKFNLLFQLTSLRLALFQATFQVFESLMSLVLHSAEVLSPTRVVVFKFVCTSLTVFRSFHEVVSRGCPGCCSFWALPVLSILTIFQTDYFDTGVKFICQFWQFTTVFFTYGVPHLLKNYISMNNIS